jgi:hypothetical protein
VFGRFLPHRKGFVEEITDNFFSKEKRQETRNKHRVA